MWPLVGRDGELGFVGELLSDRTANGVVVAGASGVGKTRLAVEVSEIARAMGFAVEWVRATRSAASVPFGAFAAFLPALTGWVAGAELLSALRHALAARARERRLVLCVDDGHLLDPGSAALLHQLVAAGETFAVVTVRSGEETPDAVRALWKDELCALLELRELRRGEVERLLHGVLGAAVDGRSVNALWELARGNALFLRELVLHGVESGTLTEADGIWRWRADVAGGLRLAELVDVRLGGLEANAWAVLELVSVGAPMQVALLDADETAALEVLERREIVRHSP
jgi:predicted ATPase